MVRRRMIEVVEARMLETFGGGDYELVSIGRC